MKNDKTFKTKTGFCHILPDKIVLTGDGLVGNFSSVTVGNSISRILVIYSLFSVFLFYNSFTYYQKEENTSALLFGALAVFLLYGVVKSLNNSATPVIERNNIQEIKFFDAKAGLTRARFEVVFNDDKKKLKKRLIMLPGSLNDGKNETEKALQIMRSEGMIK
jgi:hypothetical protein